MLKFDLHTHSTASDGVLNPAQVVERAKMHGVDVLALTDHDSTQGIEVAQNAANELGLTLIPGVEVSVTWEKQTIHIVGLNIDPACLVLSEGLKAIQETRIQRTQQVAERLEKAGVAGVIDAMAEVAATGNVTRTHFARYLVTQGKASNVREVFERYLQPGKPGYVSVEWTQLETAVQWIKAAGGISVIAHPSRYRLSATKMRRLISEFIDYGGLAIEVVHGGCGDNVIEQNTQLAKRYNLLASAGSDFHDPNDRWADVGKLRQLPSQLTPVWSQWPIGTGAMYEADTIVA